ncbi:hypothetical protein QF205_02695 [Luteimonas composti]|uniref:MFS transporter n=1 Tax=Luteimonas composti TaxID=398257 RepID=A0ABT6MN25_9GAMM|nr:hypothetical protein [Luteimonas composti]MDH7451987.1 hypothetical protein [Luteimonas composti]
MLQHARALGVALFGDPLLALAIAVEPLCTLAFGPDQRLLAVAVEAAGPIAAAVVPAIVAGLLAPRLGRGHRAPAGIVAARLLALARQVAFAIGLLLQCLASLRVARVLPGLPAARNLVARPRLFAERGLPSLRLRPLRLVTSLLALRLGTLRLLTLHLGSPPLVAPGRLLALGFGPLRRLQLLSAGAFALGGRIRSAARLHLAFRLALSSDVVPGAGLGDRTGRLPCLTRLAGRLALFPGRATRAIGLLAPRRRFRATRLAVALGAVLAAFAFAFLRDGGSDGGDCQSKREGGLEDKAEGRLLHGGDPCRHPGRRRA